MIVRIAGCSGSGKTATVKGLLDQLPHQRIVGERGKTIGYSVNDGQIYIPGKYETTAGGCDTVYHYKGGIADLGDLIERIAPSYQHLVFEGLVVTSVLTRWVEIGKRQGTPWVWCYMTTNVDECLRRIYARNGGRTINEENVWDKWNASQKQILKLREAGERVELLTPEDPTSQLRAIMGV